MSPRIKLILVAGVALSAILVIWMVREARKRPRLAASLDGWPMSLALSHDGSMMAVQDHDGRFHLWSRATNRLSPLQMETTPALKAGQITSTKMTFGPDDQTVSAWNVNLVNSSNANCSALYTWDTGTRRVRWSIVSNAKDDFSQCWIVPDGNRVVQRSYDSMKVLDITQAGTPRKTELSKFARTFPVRARFGAYVPYGAPTIVISKVGPVRGPRSFSVPETMTFSPNGKIIALARADGHVEFWDGLTGHKQAETSTSPGHVMGGWQLSYSPDGRFLALLKWGVLSLWDVGAQKWLVMPLHNAGGYGQIAWMPNSRSLWLDDHKNNIRQLSVPNFKLIRELPISGMFALSGDGKVLATRSNLTNGHDGIWFWNTD